MRMRATWLAAFDPVWTLFVSNETGYSIEAIKIQFNLKMTNSSIYKWQTERLFYSHKIMKIMLRLPQIDKNMLPAKHVFQKNLHPWAIRTGSNISGFDPDSSWIITVRFDSIDSFDWKVNRFSIPIDTVVQFSIILFVWEKMPHFSS